MFNKLCIIGVGLIGGSIARGVRERGLSHEIVGFGRIEDLDNLKKAESLGVIDSYSLEITSATFDADCVVIATPVGAIASVFNLLKPVWSPKTIYTDVGSTKMHVFSAASQVLGHVPANLVPSHPIAGAEQCGVDASRASLFDNKRLIITPDQATDAEAVEKIKAFWLRLGSQVVLMAAEYHDSVLAATSHLPHIVAFALVDMLGQRDEQTEIFKFAASGFRDFTRIASSDPTMWRDICAANKNEIIPLIQQLSNELSKIEQLLVNDDYEKLYEIFAYAGKSRQRFLDQYVN